MNRIYVFEIKGKVVDTIHERYKSQRNESEPEYLSDVLRYMLVNSQWRNFHNKHELFVKNVEVTISPIESNLAKDYIKLGI